MLQEEAFRPPEALDSYVMVEKSDVLEAIGVFVAAYLASMPEAQDLQPKQLQAALTQTFKARTPRPAEECSCLCANCAVSRQARWRVLSLPVPE